MAYSYAIEHTIVTKDEYDKITWSCFDIVFDNTHAVISKFHSSNTDFTFTGDYLTYKVTCKDCSNCIDCVNCYKCENCKKCTWCNQSKNCTNCYNSRSSENCDNCKTCTYSENCKDCSNIENCRSCESLVKCSHCYYCNDLTLCRDCKYCKNMVYCTSCENCSNGFWSTSCKHMNSCYISDNTKISIDTKHYNNRHQYSLLHFDEKEYKHACENINKEYEHTIRSMMTEIKNIVVDHDKYDIPYTFEIQKGIDSIKNIIYARYLNDISHKDIAKIFKMLGSSHTI